MPREEKAGGAISLRGKSEPPGDEGRFHFDLPKRGNEGRCLQSFFQRPSCIERIAGLDDEEERRVDPKREQARTVRRAPFA